MTTPHGQMIVTVLLPNHADQQHTYDFPSGTPIAESLEKIESVLEIIKGALGLKHPLMLDNPLITYPAAHILGIKITTVGQEALRKAAEGKQVGLIRN